jgi:hypothetical protein
MGFVVDKISGPCFYCLIGSYCNPIAAGWVDFPVHLCNVGRCRQMKNTVSFLLTTNTGETKLVPPKKRDLFIAIL